MIRSNRFTELLAQILRRITELYVMDELPIPENVLSLKDEACGIIEKAAREQNADILAEYERRLTEIHEQLNNIPA